MNHNIAAALTEFAPPQSTVHQDADPDLLHCRVQVGSHVYYGFFHSTMTATLDAMDRFTDAGKIDVRVMQ